MNTTRGLVPGGGAIWNDIGHCCSCVDRRDPWKYQWHS